MLRGASLVAPPRPGVMSSLHGDSEPSSSDGEVITTSSNSHGYLPPRTDGENTQETGSRVETAESAEGTVETATAQTNNETSNNTSQPEIMDLTEEPDDDDLIIVDVVEVPNSSRSNDTSSHRRRRHASTNPDNSQSSSHTFTHQNRRRLAESLDQMLAAMNERYAEIFRFDSDARPSRIRRTNNGDIQPVREVINVENIPGEPVESGDSDDVVITESRARSVPLRELRHRSVPRPRPQPIEPDVDRYRYEGLQLHAPGFTYQLPSSINSVSRALNNFSRTRPDSSTTTTSQTTNSSPAPFDLPRRNTSFSILWDLETNEARILTEALVRRAENNIELQRLKLPKVPTETRPGYSRTWKAEDKHICVSCSVPLGEGITDLNKDKYTDITEADISLSKRVFFASCGHVYCGRCRKNMVNRPSGRKRKRGSDSIRDRCLADKCGRSLRSAKAFHELFL